MCACLLSPACLGLFVVAVALEVLYCSLRSVTWAKTFVSGAMVGVGGLAGWVAVAPLGPGAVAFFVFLALWEIAGRNLPNDLADLGPDSAVGCTPSRPVFGPRTSATAILVGSVATVAAALVCPRPCPSVSGSPRSRSVAMVWPAVGLARRADVRAGRPYFNRASLLPALAFVVLLLGVVVGRVTGAAAATSTAEVRSSSTATPPPTTA